MGDKPIKPGLKRVKPLVNGTPRSGTLRPDPKLIPIPQGVTQRQAAYADAVWLGATQSDAYRKAYSADNLEPSALWFNAMVTMRRGGVKSRLEQLQSAGVGMVQSEHDRRKALVLTNLETIATDNSQQTGPRVKALELLGKVRGTDLFTDRVEQVQGALNADQVRAALEERLAKLGLSVSDLVRQDVGRASQAKPMLALPAPSSDTQEAVPSDPVAITSDNEGDKA